MHRPSSIRYGSLMLALSVFLATVREAAAQQSLFSNRNQNNQQSGGRSGGNSGQSGNSTSLFNPTQMGLNLRGQAGQGQQGQQGIGAAGLGNVFGNEFVGRRDDTNDFIGRRAPNGGRNAQGGQNRNRRRGGANNTGRRRFANNQNQTLQNDPNNPTARNLGQQVRPTQRRISTRHRVDFPSPAVSGSTVEASVASRFQGLIARRIDAKNLDFDVEAGGVLVMRGEVATPQDSELAALIASMEPGVRSVRNELQAAVGGEPEPTEQSGTAN